MQTASASISTIRAHAKTILLLLVTVVSVVCPQAVHAWADGGHKAIALLAWDQLTPEERGWVEHILRSHPVYQAQFAAPMHAELGESPTAEQAQRWLFCQAAIWPDLVRPSKGSPPQSPAESYHRGTWHYADLPVFPNEEMRKALPAADKEPEYAWKPGAPDFLELKLNAVQALKKAMFELANDNLSKQRQAVMLCWLFHILGDVHQPCHAAQLFTTNLLPDGDRGANSITVESLASRPLHSYWDNLLGAPGTTYDTAATVVDHLKQQASLMQAAQLKQNQLQPEEWLQEGRELAKAAVYPPPLLKEMEKLDADSATRKASESDARPRFPISVKLSTLDRQTYDATAAKLARERVAIAGLRLARVIKGLAAQ